MDIFLLYLFTRLDTWNAAAILGMAMCAIFAPMMIAYGNDCKEPVVAKWGKRCCVFGVLCALFAVLVPSQKDAALILAGSAVIEISKSESAQRIAGKSVQLIEQTLDGYLKEEK